MNEPKLNSTDKPEIKCCIKGCINMGQPHDGFAIFLCDACNDELNTLLLHEYRKRVGKLMARHGNN